MWSKPKFISLKDSSLKIAVFDSGDIHSDVQASKPILFFVHGLGLNATMWKYAAEHLVYNYRCIAIDLPGHGASWNQRGNFSMSFYAQAVRNCIEEMKLSDITLIGHSLGGQISVITALQLTAIINQLVLVSAAGIETFTTEDKQKIIQGAEFIYRSPIDTNQLLAMFTPQFSMHSDRVRELLDDQITQQKERFSAFQEMILNSIKGMLLEPIEKFLSHIQQPVLVIYGDKDQLIPNKWIHPLMSIHQIAQHAKEKITHAEIELIGSCGHYLPFEQPVIFSEKLHHFCLKHD